MTNEPHGAWQQINLWHETWQAAEHTATTHLRPLLAKAEADSTLTAWWFIRKRESWRLRLLPTRGHEAALARLTTTLTDHPAIRDHAHVIYEPETRRFGGETVMEIAHQLFHTDSRHLLTHLAATRESHAHRHELGIRLATRMMIAADQDFYEQGDIWATLADHRTTPQHPSPTAATLTAVQTLITAEGDSPDSPLTHAPAWPAGFENAGRTLADLAHHGRLARGLRAILTDHLLFAFNRLGIPAADQATLASAASQVIFHRDPTPDPASPRRRTHSVQPTTVRPVTMDTAHTTADPQQLRDALVAKIDGLGTFRTRAVKDAFHAVPRHQFLPGVELATAYAPKQVVTKRAADGTAVSSASSPNIVAIMLEQLQAAPGHHVLEIGAATGINAALLSELVGPTGSVTTIELDDDLAEGARTHLAQTGYDRVTVLCRDGALGAPDHAPFDRIIVTAGAWDIPAAWWQQLAPEGRLVVPLRLHGSGLTRSLAFDRTRSERMVSTSAATCGFVPMRGATEMGEIHVRLADEIILKVDTNDQPDETALAEALSHPAHQHWTSINIGHDEPAPHLDLWLATNSELGFGKLSVSTAARGLGLADPALHWSGASLYHGGTLAYLTARPVDDDTDELGLVTHGPGTDELTSQVNDLLHQWNHRRPEHPVVTAHHTASPTGQQAPGTHIIRPETTFTVTW